MSAAITDTLATKAASAAHPDADLLGRCAALIEMEAQCRAGLEAEQEVEPREHYQATVDAINATPAKTDEGNRAKLAAALSFYAPDFPLDSIVDPMLWDAVEALALPPSVGPVDHPDAELIQACAEHAQARQAYLEDDGEADDRNPLWVAYGRSCDILDYAKPQTVEGMLAKARAAKLEALTAEGAEHVEFTSTANSWAWDLLNDLLRLYEGT